LKGVAVQPIADAAQDHRRVTALLVLDHFAADESVQPRF
jgi:hypothetical protein